MAKKISRFLALIFLPFIGSMLIRFLYFTNKKNFKISKEITSEPVIFASWHGELLMFPLFYNHIRVKPHAKALISNHFDGELISRTVKYFGLGTLSGSSNRNAARVLIESIKTIKKGYDVGITPDGPKGPRHVVADGIVAIAQKANAKIVLIEIKPTKYWQLNSWDKFIVPKPFGTLNCYASAEIDVSSMTIEEAKLLIQEGLKKHEK